MDLPMVIYADLFLILQLLWNGYLLFLSACIVNYHLSKRKFFTFLFILSLDSFFIFQWIRWRILFLFIEWLLISMIGKSRKLCLSLFLISVLARGFWALIPQEGCLIAAIAVLIVALYIKYAPNCNIYTVYCCNGGKKVKLKALYDTGNSLLIPGNGKMVSLISYDAVKEIFSWNHVENPQIVSYSSIGNQNGLLLAVPIDSFIILEKNLEIRHPYIGIVRQNLSGEKDYQMILHKDIFNGRERKI